MPLWLTKTTRTSRKLPRCQGTVSAVGLIQPVSVDHCADMCICSAGIFLEQLTGRPPLRSSVHASAAGKIEKRMAKIRHKIIQRDKRQRQLLQCIELAIERITTGASIAELAKRHNLSESKVRRHIENAIFLARSRMYEKNPSRPPSPQRLRQDRA